MKRILHVFFHPSEIHNINFYNLMADKDFDQSYLCLYENVYEKLKEKENVEFLEHSIFCSQMDYILNKYETVFFHSINLSSKHLLKLKSEICNKIIWVVWGHDLYGRTILFKESKSLISFVKQKIKAQIFNTKVGQFKGIGIGFKYDSLEIRRVLKQTVSIYKLPYPGQWDIEEIDQIPSTVGGTLRVVIGHSGYPFLNHIKLMEQLKAYKDYDIQLVLPMSYGDKAYIGEVEEYVKMEWKEKATVIKDFYYGSEYLKLVNSCDIAIFDMNVQSALGNIYLFLYYGKKVYLNPNGILYQAAILENMEVGSTGHLKDLSFEDFAKPVMDAEPARNFVRPLLSQKQIYQNWSQCMENNLFI